MKKLLMKITALNVLGALLSGVPFLAIAGILLHYALRHAVWKRRKRRGASNPGFCPSAAALGMAFLFLPVFYRPSLAHLIQARQHQHVEEDDEGDPDTPARHLHHQLRKIRRGEPVNTLVLRL
jgi:hypothetical protein